MSFKYNFDKIEKKWQKIWEDKKIYKTPHEKKWQKKDKFYILDMFPYPSGSGLHVGHPKGYTATDVIARYKRMKGFNVLHPMAWDSFGLPTERAAERENVNPLDVTKKNINNFKKQIKRLGFSYDWDLEFSTTDKEFYKWTQWIFLKLYEKNLAYMSDIAVNWCPKLKTVLANEEVRDGKYIETGDIVEKKNMRQWMLKITAYAERLLIDLDDLDWPNSIKEMQRNWIGKTKGTEIKFTIKNSNLSFKIFTTRPETIFGVTYCILSPEHNLIPNITTKKEKLKVKIYLEGLKNKSNQERINFLKEKKTGVFTGSYSIHPITNKEIPIWIADYVLINYGTGAIMAVPAHDERDHSFAKEFNLPLIEVISGSKIPITEKAYTDLGICINSNFLNDLDSKKARKKIINFLETKQIGCEKIKYKLRDWLFSRQRYWGEPFPIVHLENSTIITIPEIDLPVELPEIDKYKTKNINQSSLSKAKDDWIIVKLPDGKKATRELNTMPQWAGSCWYYLYYLRKNKDKSIPWSNVAEKYWMPVDLYIGGVEHAVLHLLYARFWHKVLYDCNLVSTKEPFKKLFNQGMILANSYQDKNGKYYYSKEIYKKNKNYFVKENNLSVKTQIEKMSKSRYNVVNPDEIIKDYGADTLRLYELFIGPLSTSAPWQMKGLQGIHRFLERVWRTFIMEESNELNYKIKSNAEVKNYHLEKILHKSIKIIEESIESIDKLNIGISQLMIFINETSKIKYIPKNILEQFLLLLSPYAPHLAEELWNRLGNEDLIVNQTWPKYNSSLCKEKKTTIVLQVNSKIRAKIIVNLKHDENQLKKIALNNENIKRFIKNKKIKKIIIIPNKLINLVI